MVSESGVERRASIRSNSKTDVPTCADPNDRPSLTILTYNINYSAAATAEFSPTEVAVLRTLKEQASECDIISLQEVHKDWHKLIKRELADSHPYCVKYLPSEEKDDEAPPRAQLRESGGLSVFSKHPMRQATVVPTHKILTKSWFPQFYALVDVPALDKPLLFCGVHLRPPLGPKGGFGPRSMTRTSKVRVRELRAVMDDVDAKIPGQFGHVVIAGDFNENSNHRATRFLHRNKRTGHLHDVETGKTHHFPLGSKVTFS